MADHVDEYLQKGMYGEKQTKPDERRKFLGTLRERIVIALTQPQVRKSGVNKEAEKAMQENREAHLYLNGNMNYEYLSKYMKAASKYHIEYTMVTNKDHNTDIGLVLAYDYAIDKENIFVDEGQPQLTPEIKKPKKGFFAKLFKGN
ncbi:YueI family protein [Cytobacillus gottheilii]|uniref:YueI family protein n=1 Tax=Cytobacillus gottheilii TaxID=859144 RepID=UPI0009B9499D|nr:YueI family protein [Cytobacillus gottheilii]